VRAAILPLIHAAIERVAVNAHTIGAIAGKAQNSDHAGESFREFSLNDSLFNQARLQYDHDNVTLTLISGFNFDGFLSYTTLVLNYIGHRLAHRCVFNIDAVLL
jgi:hypothetical protein